MVKDAKTILAAAQENESRAGLLLASPDGGKLMDILRDLYYDCTIASPDTTATYFALGQREVVRYLMDLQRKAKEK